MNELKQQEDQLQTFASRLIAEASELQTKINGSKTQVKRAYYTKKMKKIRTDVQQVLATLQLVKLAEARQNAATATTGPSETAEV